MYKIKGFVRKYHNGKSNGHVEWDKANLTEACGSWIIVNINCSLKVYIYIYLNLPWSKLDN